MRNQHQNSKTHIRNSSKIIQKAVTQKIAAQRLHTQATGKRSLKAIKIVAGLFCMCCLFCIPMTVFARMQTVIHTITHNVYHEHTGNATEGGGCYTAPTYHTHTGDVVNGGACYEMPVYHVHEGSTEAGGACYETPVYHVHSGSSSTGGGCYTGAVYHSHNSGCYTYGVTHSCSVVAADCHGTDETGRTWYTWTYSCGASVSGTSGDGYHGTTSMGNILTCGRGGAVEGYTMQCGKSEESIDGYLLSCVKTDTTIDSYCLSCTKTAETVDGYELACGKTEETVDSTYETYEEVQVDDGVEENPAPEETKNGNTDQPTEIPEETEAPILFTATPAAIPDSAQNMENATSEDETVNTRKKAATPSATPTASPLSEPSASPSPLLRTETKTVDVIPYDASPTETVQVKRMSRIREFLLTPVGKTITITASGLLLLGGLLFLLLWIYGSISIYNNDSTDHYVWIGRKRAYKENGVWVLEISNRITERAYTNKYQLKAGKLFCRGHENEELLIKIENVQTTVTLDTKMVFRI